jgi:hypothetical protein
LIGRGVDQIPAGLWLLFQPELGRKILEFRKSINFQS